MCKSWQKEESEDGGDGDKCGGQGKSMYEGVKKLAHGGSSMAVVRGRLLSEIRG